MPHTMDLRPQIDISLRTHRQAAWIGLRAFCSWVRRGGDLQATADRLDPGASIMAGMTTDPGAMSRGDPKPRATAFFSRIHGNSAWDLFHTMAPGNLSTTYFCDPAVTQVLNALPGQKYT